MFQVEITDRGNYAHHEETSVKVTDGAEVFFLTFFSWYDVGELISMLRRHIPDVDVRFDEGFQHISPEDKKSLRMVS